MLVKYDIMLVLTVQRLPNGVLIIEKLREDDEMIWNNQGSWKFQRG
jgi:hypothetical protein